MRRLYLLLPLLLAFHCAKAPAEDAPEAGDLQNLEAGTLLDGTPEGVNADACSPSEASVNLSLETIEVHGQTRSFTLGAPAASCGPLSLLFVFHGDGGEGGRTQHFLHLEDTVRGRAVVVYPDGMLVRGVSTWDLTTAPDSNPDVAFFDALVASLQTRFPIHERRVFATGLSRGAYFTNQLGCVRGNVLRAIAPHSGGGPNWMEGFDGVVDSYEGRELTRCPTPSVSAMVIHGLNDTTVLPEEGQGSRLHWEHANLCSNQRSTSEPSPCEESQFCSDGRRVLWCAIPGLGHGYWSAVRESIWAFFEATALGH